MSGGRPSKYDPAFCEMVRDAGREGKTLAEMAAVIGVNRATVTDWCNKHPEFSSAIKDGLDSAQAWWEGQGRVATFGGVNGFNATSYIFQMKNRFRDDWNDRVITEHDGKVQTEEVGQGAAKLAAFLDAVSSRTPSDPAE